MKKTFLILSAIILSLILASCETKEQTISCKGHSENGYDESYVMTAKKGNIYKLDINYLYDNELFAIDTFSTLSDSQKEEIKSNMLTNLKLEKTSYDGLNIKIDIDDRINVLISADLEVADEKLLKNIGLDFTNTNRSLLDAVKSFEDEGYICK